MRESLGEERLTPVLEALGEVPPVSVRVNPFKISIEDLRNHFGKIAGDPVPWAREEAFYLNERPSFTHDPLFHAGAYYVQEASSMYVGYLLENAFASSDLKGHCRILDLCAAPGGKTTQILSHMTSGDYLIANEVIYSRVPILSENVAKWGCSNVTVTNSDATAFAGEKFDVVIVDAPCSGEGMFRKDTNAVENWSLNNVNLCAQRQRRIVSDIWNALIPGGFLIYSTCTFNRYEDEDNVGWICDQLGGESLEMRHFYPGEDVGEGFFAALIRKGGCSSVNTGAAKGKKTSSHRYREYKTLFPEADEALSIELDRSKYVSIDLNLEDALKFLAREPLVFPEAELGLILLTYKGIPLGFVKNLGRRSNNLYPMPRRIRNL